MSGVRAPHHPPSVFGKAENASPDRAFANGECPERAIDPEAKTRRRSRVDYAYAAAARASLRATLARQSKADYHRHRFFKKRSTAILEGSPMRNSFKELP